MYYVVLLQINTEAGYLWMFQQIGFMSKFILYDGMDVTAQPLSIFSTKMSLKGCINYELPL